MPNKIVNGFCTFLGVFEFFAGISIICLITVLFSSVFVISVSKLLLKGADSHEILFQPFLASSATTALFAAFTLILGLQRLTFSTGDGGLFPWLCLVATHVFESIFWWYIAVDIGVLDNSSVVDLLVRLLSNRTEEDKHLFILLFFVPVIALTFLASGPTAVKRVEVEVHTKKS